MRLKIWALWGLQLSVCLCLGLAGCMTGGAGRSEALGQLSEPETQSRLANEALRRARLEGARSAQACRKARRGSTVTFFTDSLG